MCNTLETGLCKVQLVSYLPREANHHLHCFESVELKVIVTAPGHQLVNLPPVSRLFPTRVDILVLLTLMCVCVCVCVCVCACVRACVHVCVWSSASPGLSGLGLGWPKDFHYPILLGGSFVPPEGALWCSVGSFRPTPDSNCNLGGYIRPTEKPVGHSPRATLPDHGTMSRQECFTREQVLQQLFSQQTEKQREKKTVTMEITYTT